MSARAEIAAAASTAPGITCQPYYVQGTQPGLAFVRLERTEYDAFGGIAFYNVVVLVPQDLAEAEKYAEANLPALRAAIGKALPVTSARLQQLDIQGVGTLPTLFINGHREADS